MSRSAQSRGFTLLEVMIAMAILAMALVALIGHEGVAIQMSDYSNRMSQATLLAQGKLLDIEHKMTSDSIDIYDNCEDGDFRDEGFDKFKWKVCAIKLEIPEGAEEQMVEQIMAMMGGVMDPAALSGAAAALGAAGGADADKMGQVQGQIAMAIGAIPIFLKQLEEQMRKVRLEVTWRDAIDDRSLVFERFVTQLGSDPGNGPPPKDGAAAVDLNDVATQ